MTILSNNNIKTFYTIETNIISRAIDNKLHHINLDDLKDLTVSGLARMCELDNEAFKLMSIIQGRKK